MDFLEVEAEQSLKSDPEGEAMDVVASRSSCKMTVILLSYPCTQGFFP